MAVEFDHLFIFTDLGAPEADQLVAFGLIEGSSNTHSGQGTANRRFFFHNAMLELLWVHNPAEVRSEVIRRTRLWERWDGRDSPLKNTCPIGIGFRPAESSKESTAFPSWDYRPPYLPETLSISVATNNEILSEPWLFQIPFGGRPDRLPPEKAQPLNHPDGLREITRVEIISPVATSPSLALQAVIDSHQIQLQHGTDYYVELGFDEEKQGQRTDFRPRLPLIMRW
jgi:hypothetical protein